MLKRTSKAHVRKRLATIALLLGSMLVTGAVVAQQRAISIATGGTGGVYYPLGGGLANVLSKAIPGLQATAEVTGGSVDNLKLINSGGSEVAFVMVDAALDAYKGQDKFKGTEVPVRTLMVLYPNQMHVVTIEGTGIEKMADLKGKRVSTGSGGSATEVMAFRVIEAAGLDKDRDMKRERLGVAKSVNAIKDRKIDAFFWVGGLPTSAVTDLGATPGVKLKLIDHGDLAAKMNANTATSMPRAPSRQAPIQPRSTDNVNTVVWNILVSNAKMSDQDAYAIVKTIFDKKADLVAVHSEAKNFDLKNQVKDYSPIPWHPGAVKYLTEQGVKM